MSGPRHYFDHNATTPVEPEVLDRFVEIERTCPGNSSSIHQLGRRARSTIEDARVECADALGVELDDVVFVSSGTEANNAAIGGLGDLDLPVGLGPHEHASILRAAERRGAHWWSVDRAGRVQLDVSDPPPALGMVALVHAQSEVGTLQPVVEAAHLAHTLGIPFHCDAAQSLGRVEIRTPLDHADSISLSTHKAGGLRGGSVWVVRERARTVRPLLVGGEHERGLRASTPSPALIAATARAVSLAVRDVEHRSAAMRASRAALLSTLHNSGCVFACLTPSASEDKSCTTDEALPNTALLAFPHVDGRNLVPALDIAGIEVSAGSACSSGSPQPPRVLGAMGIAEANARSVVRFSTSHRTTVDAAIDAAKRIASVVSVLQR